MSKKYVLLTRPLESSLKIEEALLELDLKAHIEPLLSIEDKELKNNNLSDYDGFIITSSHALHVFHDLSDKQSIMNKPVYVVGDAIAERARALGFQYVHSASGNLDDLERLVHENSDLNARYLYLRGQDISRPIDSALFSQKGIMVEETVVYAAAATDHLTDKLLEKLEKGQISHVLFFSKRTAGIFRDLVNRHGCTSSLESTKALCLADSMLEFVSEMPWEAVYVSPEPNRQALLALLKQSV